MTSTQKGDDHAVIIALTLVKREGVMEEIIEFKIIALVGKKKDL